MTMRPEILQLRAYVAEHDKDMSDYLKSLCEDVCFLAEQLDEANMDLYALAHGIDVDDDDSNEDDEIDEDNNDE